MTLIPGNRWVRAKTKGGPSLKKRELERRS
jgi:hypothetical protein